MALIYISKTPRILVETSYLESDLEKIELSVHPEGFYLQTHEDPDPKLVDWLYSYSKKNAPPFPYLLPKMPPFQRIVLETLSKVPFGTLLSYQTLASQAGNPNASRAAGTACGKNPFPLLIPCHRIIASNGSLGGFSAGCLSIKRELLVFEGHSF